MVKTLLMLMTRFLHPSSSLPLGVTVVDAAAAGASVFVDGAATVAKFVGSSLRVGSCVVAVVALLHWKTPTPLSEYLSPLPTIYHFGSAIATRTE